MALLTLKNAELAFGTQAILHGAELVVEPGERLALIGRNGAGKSTLLKVIDGTTHLDDGELWLDDAVQIARLEQAVPESLSLTVAELVSQGLDSAGEEQWQYNHQIERIIDQLNLPGDSLMADCSGGLRRRAMLAKALVCEPDLLLLDEPTNHLDIESIEKLENILLSSACTLMLVSHDRALIDKLATRIVELDRGQLNSYPGNFSAYQNLRAKAEAEEADENKKFDQKLAAEETWIRQGIKARRTRNEGRVRRLQELRKQRAARVDKQGNARLKVETGGRSGDIVAVLDEVSFAYESPLLTKFSTQINRRDRLAIIGPNGAGKSTLIKLIVGELEPDSGQITRGTRLQVAYFDQHRSALDLNATVRDNVNPNSDQITVGKQTKHIAGYLSDFLFPGSYLNMPAAKLSGGERNRLLMAKLFSQPANLLVLDEPTNDLDMETLELFEELLNDYPGTIILVSHDRAFIDAVATSVIAFEPTGVHEYVGGYSDWQRQRRSTEDAEAKSKASPMQKKGDAGKSTKNKLSYKIQRELDGLPEQIETLETEQQSLQDQVSQADFYQQPDTEVKTTLQNLSQISEKIEQAYARWEELSELQ